MKRNTVKTLNMTAQVFRSLHIYSRNHKSRSLLGATINLVLQGTLFMLKYYGYREKSRVESN